MLFKHLIQTTENFPQGQNSSGCHKIHKKGNNSHQQKADQVHLCLKPFAQVLLPKVFITQIYQWLVFHLNFKVLKTDSRFKISQKYNKALTCLRSVQYFPRQVIQISVISI